MPKLPFSIFKRSGRKFFYVHFKRKDGGYLPAVSTKQLTESAAIETAFQWLRNGQPYRAGKNKTSKKNGSPVNHRNDLISISLREVTRNIKNSTEAEFICRELKRQGVLKTYEFAKIHDCLISPELTRFKDIISKIAGISDKRPALTARKINGVASLPVDSLLNPEAI